MSTDSIPTDARTNGIGTEEGGSGDARAPSLVAELVFRELLEAEAALAEPDLRERTLLPAVEVRQALAELESRGLCSVRRRTDHERRRYVATFPPEPGA